MTKRKQKLPAHHAVSSLRVTGGFLGGAVLEFADGLNCLIGGSRLSFWLLGGLIAVSWLFF